jgi:F1F0 ATPase subunit 2
MLVGLALDARAMTPLFTKGDDALALVAGSAAWLAAGGLVGAFHFLTLHRSVRMLAAGASLLLALALHLVRFAITVGALTVIARHGALPLLASMLGLLASRATVLGVSR